MELHHGFIQDAIKRLEYYKSLGDRTFDQLSEKDFHFQPSSGCNSIAVLIRHLYGNMVSRWTNFLSEDGEKQWRKREEEFATQEAPKQDLMSIWNEGWICLFNALNALQPEDLLRTVYIRSEPILVYDAILRQLAHYPYHVGQIVFLGKMIRNTEWKSLSIPKG